MDLKILAHQTASWLSGEADMDGIVVSCRARLARNLNSCSFTHRAGEGERATVVGQVVEATQRSRRLAGAQFVDMNELADQERRLLVERHLVSPALAEGRGVRGVLFSADESISIMVNEEDHLRLQAVLPGLQPGQAWNQINAVDDALGRHLEYAQSEQWGYLTACPTNTGTGLRVSVLIHLPGLVLAEDMERVVRGLTQMAFTVRGVYGEGTNAAGNLFQISNQATLGASEEDLSEQLVHLTRQVVEYERDAQETLLKEARYQLEDKIWRAYAILSHARVLSSQEFASLLSALRLGYSLSLIRGVTSPFLNRLMIITQSAHLQVQAERPLGVEERDVQRANIVRQLLAEQAASGGEGAP
ncbi:MAG: protein arginine kinase [Candidatus Latescibacteria bacterium]|nr:protein arginine kinase [Candidatus Latescibacterota bacterium]